MNTTSIVITAGDSASSGWFEGWIGGLIAAAVTISATVWWESRSRRKERLEAALAHLADTALTFRTAVLRGAPPSDGQLLADLALVRAVASSRVLPLKWAWVRPWRSGLVRTLDVLKVHFVEQLGPLHQKAPLASVAAAEAADSLRALALTWLEDPKQFAESGVADAMKNKSME